MTMITLHLAMPTRNNASELFSVSHFGLKNQSHEKNDKSLVFVYAQALVLAHIDHHREVLIGVVLYNIALTNHARAIEKNKSSFLLVALKLYSMAVAIVKAAVVKDQNDDDVKSSSYLLLFALYNNMAQIYLTCASSEKLRQCLGNINALLHVDRIEQVIDDDDYAFFATNAMLQLRVVASPAA
jgi:hypothetical protein